jgi:hypothetical protein
MTPPNICLPKTIGLKRALIAMSKGARLMKMHANNLPNGYAYYIVPGGYIRPDQAQKIIDRPDVCVYDDGLLSGHPQTWKIG